MAVSPCIVCGRTVSPRLAVVYRKGRFRVDEACVNTDKGDAVLCARISCIREAHEKRLLESFFHVQVPLRIYTELAGTTQKYNSGSAALIGFGRKANKIVFGFTAVKQETERGKAFLLIVDPEAGPTLEKRMTLLSRKTGVPLYRYRDEKSLSEISGKSHCKCAAICDSGLAAAVKKRIDPLTRYELKEHVT